MVYPVIMAGGVGSRFWPWSTPDQPKQFLRLLHPKKTMIEMTVDRFTPLFSRKNIRVVSHKNFRPLLKKHLKGIKVSQLLLEPMMKNTAPCIGWAAKELVRKDPEAIMVVVSADSHIKKEKQFQKDVKRGVQFVKANPEAILTFGIKPRYPETGYGYIECGSQVAGPVYSIRRFVEKPTLPKAKRLLQSKRYLWNSGLFIWKAKTILSELKKHQPDLYSILNQLTKKNVETSYKKFPKISIDYSVLEKSKNVHVLSSSFEWSDIGNWLSLFQARNSKEPRWISIDSKNCHVKVNGRQVATVGVSDLIVVDHPKNGLLICHADQLQRVREVLDRL